MSTSFRTSLRRRASTGASIAAAFCSALLCAALPSPSFAQAPATAPAAVAAAPNRYAATLTPSERFEVGGVLVERHGAARGRPLILIPGLASGSWVWQDTIRAFAADHPVYVLTLPGFDGRPPAGETPFATARAAVETLISSRRLDKPVIVGHSLGGVLGIAIAEDRPQLLGGLVSIDGLPVFPGTEDMPQEARPAFADGTRGRLLQQPADKFAGQQEAYMRTIGVMDMGRASDLARLSARSDPGSAARYVADILALDLRPGLKSVTAPVLLVMPFLDLDAQQTGQTEKEKADYYRALMDGTPNLTVTPVAPARHFVMIDQPQATIDALRAFLARL